MSLAAQKQRLLQQVNAILVATTKTFGDRDRNQFVSFRQQGFPVISTENWLIVGAVFVNGGVMLLDEREQHFQVQSIFDSSDQDALISLADTLHGNGLSAWRSAQYCELLNEHNGPALNPVTVVFHQDDQHLSTEDAQLCALSPDTLRQLLSQQGAWPIDETKPVEFSIYNVDDADTELMSGAIHPAFILQ